MCLMKAAMAGMCYFCRTPVSSPFLQIGRAPGSLLSTNTQPDKPTCLNTSARFHQCWTAERGGSWALFVGWVAAELCGHRDRAGTPCRQAIKDWQHAPTFHNKNLASGHILVRLQIQRAISALTQHVPNSKRLFSTPCNAELLINK